MNSPASKSIYLLDTNVLIDFALFHPISLCKSFWQKLETSLSNKEWVLLDVVIDEIKYNPELLNWCNNQKKKGFVNSVSDDNRNRGAEINNTYKMVDDVTGNSSTDPYLIAYAEEHKLTLFTRESNRRTSSDLYKIPDVCQLLKVPCIKRPIVFLKSIGYSN